MVSSREVIQALKADGWNLASVSGSHHHFRHTTKPGKVTVPHPRKDFPMGTLRSIEKQAGIRLT
jgi:predicted RNA binding protein YcfA (HicA-like mRNA interferase family)